MSSAICFNLDQSKILSSGNGLNRNKLVYYHCPSSFRSLNVPSSACSRCPSFGSVYERSRHPDLLHSQFPFDTNLKHGNEKKKNNS